MSNRLATAQSTLAMRRWRPPAVVTLAAAAYPYAVAQFPAATIGFDTAVQICTEAIDRLHTTAESHNRIIVVETMGRHAGWIALFAGILAAAVTLKIGVRAIKVEGRQRSPTYVAQVTRTLRAALDSLRDGSERFHVKPLVQ